MTTNRFSLSIAVTVIAALAVLTISMATSSRKPVASDSISNSYAQVELVRAARSEAAAARQTYLDQRRGEQMAGHVVLVPQAALTFRQAEQIASAADAQQADLAFREGEWNAGVSPAQAYLNFRRGEWSGK